MAERTTCVDEWAWRETVVGAAAALHTVWCPPTPLRRFVFRTIRPTHSPSHLALTQWLNLVLGKSFH